MNLRTILSKFGAAVQSHRKAQGFTLPDLAGRAGLSKGHLSEIEHGHCNLSLETIHRLASALRISPAELLK